MPRPRVLALLVVALATALAPPPTVAQIEAFPRPDTLQAASFGVSVALNDSIAAVGASGASVCGPDAGAVFIYERRPGPLVTSWALTARIVPRPCRAKAFFGADLALSGSRLLVSASSEHFAGEGENAAYVFERSADGSWAQTARLTGESSRREGLFAAGVALHGNRAAVTTSGSPQGAYGGAVYVFEYAPDTGTWTQTARQTAPQNVKAGILGGDVALHGSSLAVAASTYFERQPGSVYVFRRNPATGRWLPNAHLQDIDSFFIDLALHDSTLLVGEDRAGDEEAGAATVYTRRDTSWTRTATFQPSIPYESGAFGATVALHESRALITGYDEQLGNEINIDRVVYVFRRRGDAWREQTILDLGTVDFGSALALHDRVALIGSVPENESGTVYVTQVPR
jgi:hypothetical protein